MRAALRVGIVFELLGCGLGAGKPTDWDAEYEPERTIETLEAALRRLGCEPVRIGNPHALLKAAGEAGAGPLSELDAALSIAEAYGSRNREAWAPVLLEMLRIPSLGSDALTLSLSLDKAWTKTIVAAAGVPTLPHAQVLSLGEFENLQLPAPFPLFVKPRFEGTAKGITPRSRVESIEALREAVTRVLQTYEQPAMIEPFLAGAEYTVTVVGSEGRGGPHALPVLQRAIEKRTGIGVHALERHDPAELGLLEWEYILPGSLDTALEQNLQGLGLRAFRALECKDFARVDFRLDTFGAPWFLEINTLPTFDPQGSFGILAQLQGRSAEELLAEVFRAGLERLGVMPP